MIHVDAELDGKFCERAKTWRRCNRKLTKVTLIEGRKVSFVLDIVHNGVKARMHRSKIDSRTITFPFRTTTHSYRVRRLLLTIPVRKFSSQESVVPYTTRPNQETLCRLSKHQAIDAHNQTIDLEVEDAYKECALTIFDASKTKENLTKHASRLRDRCVVVPMAFVACCSFFPML
jgi:hypothetical protein